MKKLLRFMFFIPIGLENGIRMAWLMSSAPIFWPFDWNFDLRMTPLNSWNFMGKDILKVLRKQK